MQKTRFVFQTMHISFCRDYVERNQRPSVMGRKNYLFSKSDSGAVDNAIFYPLIESCEIVGVNPLQWLTHVLQSLHDDTTAEQIIQILPYNSRIEHREFFYSKQYGLFWMVTINRHTTTCTC